MFDMFATLAVFKLLRFREARDLQLPNIYHIYVTLSTLKLLPKVSAERLSQP
jgi:hypothetical protein